MSMPLPLGAAPRRWSHASDENKGLLALLVGRQQAILWQMQHPLRAAAVGW